MNEYTVTNHRLQGSACPGYPCPPIQGLGSQPTVWQNTGYFLGRKSVWTGSLGWLTKGPGSGGCTLPHEPSL